MSERPIGLFLRDVLEACDRIQLYVKDINYDPFVSNPMIKDAVERNIEIIGEACNKLPLGYQILQPEVDWQKPIGMRNWLIHGYFAVDVPMLWNTITIVIPTFKEQIEKLVINSE